MRGPPPTVPSAPKKPRIKTSSAKGKGRELQQDVARLISELIGLPHGKDQPIESRPMGQSGVDIRLDQRARRRFPWAVECKRQENWAIPAWIKQAQANCSEELPDWLLVCRRNRSRAVVVLDAERFFALLSLIPSPVKGPP